MAVHVLDIGINDYVGTQNDLTKSVADAKGFSALFKAKPYLLNQQATRPAVMKAVQQFSQLPGPGDWYVGHYSGHGSQIVDKNRDEGDRKDEVIVTADLKYVVDDEYLPLISGRNTQARFLQVFDSCFSGDMTRTLSLPRENFEPFQEGTQAKYLPPRLLQNVERRAVQNVFTSAYIPNVIVISGCADFEYSYEGNQYGVLTGALIQTYRKDLTIGQWFILACQVIQRSRFSDKQHPQINCHPSCLNWKVPAVA